MGIYRHTIRPALFAIDPERAHTIAIRLAELAGAFSWPRRRAQQLYSQPHPVLQTSAAGLTFHSPVGLSAGLDKNARAVNFTAWLGFGFLETGSATLRPWTGNTGCRMARMASEHAIWSRYGLPNEGISKIADRFEGYAGAIPLGLSIAAVHEGRPQFNTDLAIEEFAAAFAQTPGAASYAVINLACPNCDGHDLFRRLEDIDRLASAVEAAAPPHLPLFIKLADRNDVGWSKDFVAMLGAHARIAGISPIPVIMQERKCASGVLNGTVTGAPLRNVTLDIIARWSPLIDRRRHVLIASGGIASGQDAYTAIRAGATLVQIFSALAYDGPGLVSRINRELAALLARDGFDSVRDAVGADMEGAEIAGVELHAVR